MPEEFATRAELNNMGLCINNIKQKQAKCEENKDVRLKTLEVWTREQEGDLKDIKQELGSTNIKIHEMKDVVIKEVSKNVTITVGIMTVVLVAMQLLLK